MSERRRPESPEDLQRRLSKTVLHAAERRRRSLFERLTADNAEKLEELLKQEPLHYERNEDAPSALLIDDAILDELPDAEGFFLDPTDWIERLPTLSKGRGVPIADEIKDYWQFAYDATKVKSFDLLNGQGVISKRLEQREVTEVTVAQRAYAAGIPTPKVLAEICQQGNLYAWFERIEGRNLLSVHLEKETMRQNNSDKLYVEIRGPYLGDGKIFREHTRHLVKILSTKGGLSPDQQKSRDELMNFLRDKLQSLPKNVDRLMSRVKHSFPEAKDFVSQHGSVDEQRKFRRLVAECEVSVEPLADILAIMPRYLSAGFRVDIAELRTASPSRSEVERFLGYYDSLRGSKGSSMVDLERVWAKARDRVVGMQRRIFKVVDEINRRYFDEEFDCIPELQARKSELERLCQEKGMVHKDFADRNFVVAWDDKKNQPRRDAAGKPLMYIVDWEQKDSPSKNSSK